MLSAESYQNIISYLIRQLWRIFPKALAHTQIHKHTSTHHGFVMKVLSLLPCWYDKRKHNSAAEAHKQSDNLYSSDIEWFWHEISGVRGQESDGLRHPSSCVCAWFSVRFILKIHYQPCFAKNGKILSYGLSTDGLFSFKSFEIFWQFLHQFKYMNCHKSKAITFNENLNGT